MILFRALTLLILCTLPVQAERTLSGRSVVFSVLAYDNPDTPLFVGKRHDAVVGDGVEFGLGPEGLQNDLDVVPVLIDISATRLVISFEATPPSELHDSEFNGYVLEFLTDCLLFQDAKLDTRVTTLPMTNADIFWKLGTLYINASGFETDEHTRIAVDFTVADCAIS